MNDLMFISCFNEVNSIQDEEFSKFLIEQKKSVSRKSVNSKQGFRVIAKRHHPTTLGGVSESLLSQAKLIGSKVNPERTPLSAHSPYDRFTTVKSIFQQNGPVKPLQSFSNQRPVDTKSKVIKSSFRATQTPLVVN